MDKASGRQRSLGRLRGSIFCSSSFFQQQACNSHKSLKICPSDSKINLSCEVVFFGTFSMRWEGEVWQVVVFFLSGKNVIFLTFSYPNPRIRLSVCVSVTKRPHLTHYPLLLRSWIAANTLSKGWIVC